MILYTVFNSSIDECTNPFMVKNDKVAILNFKNGLQSHLDKEPNFDVTSLRLYKLCDIDPETMVLSAFSSVPITAPVLVYSGDQYLKGE